MTVYGWDLSNHDWARHPVSLADARNSGISFVTHKVTEGTNYQDPYFDDYVRQLARAGFPVAGSYHAAHRGHAVAEADFWFDTVTAKYPDWRRHPCWIWQIDAEPLDGYPAPTRADVIAMGARLEQRGVARASIVVYGPRWVYGEGLNGIPYRLWASSYVPASSRAFKRTYPGDKADHWAAYSGQTPLILQYTSSATIGAQHTCDANAIRVKNEAELAALFVGAPTPPADILEEIMALPGAPKTYAEFLNDIRDAVRTAPITNSYGGKATLEGVMRAVDKHVNDSAGALSSVATVANDAVVRVAKLQAAVAALPAAQQAAADVAAIAAATADAVIGKLRDLVLGVK